MPGHIHLWPCTCIDQCLQPEVGMDRLLSNTGSTAELDYLHWVNSQREEAVFVCVEGVSFVFVQLHVIFVPEDKINLSEQTKKSENMKIKFQILLSEQLTFQVLRG